MTREIIEKSKAVIPPLDAILERAWQELRLSEKHARENMGEVLVKLDHVATELYLAHEREALRELSRRWLETQKPSIKRKMSVIAETEGWEAFIEKASQLFTEFGMVVRDMEKDLGNMRKARGGQTFQKAILKTLIFLGIPAEPTASRSLGRIDIVIPSKAVAMDTPDRAVFLTCKRTLRERWKQEVPQAKGNRRIYLLTIDPNLAASKAREIHDMNLVAFVRDELKASKEIKDMRWIRRLSELPKELAGSIRS